MSCFVLLYLMMANEEESMELGSNDSDVMLEVDEERPSKRARSESTPVDPQLLEHAKSRLSKWAARLFDPDRPKGLMQPPETIPLNDEHLKAFGQRVKQEQFDLQQITTTIDSDDDDEDKGDLPTMTESSTKKKKAKEGTKLKITNMAYTTDAGLLPHPPAEGPAPIRTVAHPKNRGRFAELAERAS